MKYIILVMLTIMLVACASTRTASVIKKDCTKKWDTTENRENLKKMFNEFPENKNSNDWENKFFTEKVQYVNRSIAQTLSDCFDYNLRQQNVRQEDEIRRWEAVGMAMILGTDRGLENSYNQNNLKLNCTTTPDGIGGSTTRCY